MKKLRRIIVCLLCLMMIVVLMTCKKNEKIYKEETKKERLLTLMVEKEAGSGKYEEFNEKIPSTGYYLNTELSGCENGGKLLWNEDKRKAEVDLITSDKCYLYFDRDDIGSICRGKNLSSCFIQNYKKAGSLIYHDGNCDYDGEENCNLEAGDLSYRYSGANDVVNNYVCFGGDSETCPSNNLYRIIGFFSNDEEIYETKLIKADYTTTTETGTSGEYFGFYPDSGIPGGNGNYLGDKVNYYPKIATYYWNNTTKKSNWLESLLNTENLNKYFYEQYLTDDDREFITKNKWYIKGDVYSRVLNNNAYNTYLYEIKSQNKEERFPAYIGLIYISDYMYGASSNNWQLMGLNNNKPLTDYRNSISDNWLYMGLNEWTITRWKNETVDYGCVGIQYNGTAMDPSIYQWKFAVRPVFYLKSSTKLLSGNGEKNNPYRLTI